MSRLVPISLTAAACLALLASPQQPSSGLERPTTMVESSLVSPIRIARTGSGKLVVSDYYSQRLLMLNGSGTKELDEFAVSGRPLGVAATSDLIYFGNTNTKCVEIIDHGGAHLGSLGGPLTKFEKPTEIALDVRRSLVFVLDGEAKEVRVFDVSTGVEGNPAWTIPPAGSTTNPFVNPTGLAVDPRTTEILVSDHGDGFQFSNASILTFDYLGNQTGTIQGSDGWFGKRFSRPQGLEVHDKYIYLTESMLGRVLILDRATGADVGSLGTHGKEYGQLDLPLDLVLDTDAGDVYVTDNLNRRVQRFVGGVLP